MDHNELLTLVRQHAEIKKQMDLLSTRFTEVKNRLADALKENGVEDNGGHKVIEINDDQTGVEKLVYQRRVSKSLDMDAADTLLEEKGLLDRCTMTVPILDEVEIMAAYQEDLLTDADIDAMFPSKESWALLVR